MMLEQSSQAMWLKPVVISLSYGLLVAFFVTLFLVPALLILGERWRLRKAIIKKSIMSRFKREKTLLSDTGR